MNSTIYTEQLIFFDNASFKKAPAQVTMLSWIPQAIYKKHENPVFKSLSGKCFYYKLSRAAFEW
jgi:hypothetical protein